MESMFLSLSTIKPTYTMRDGNIKIGDLKYKILGVLADARIVAKNHELTARFAKHYVALGIKLSLGNPSDRKLADFLAKDELLKLYTLIEILKLYIVLF